MSILILFYFVLGKSVISYMYLHFDFPQVVSPLKLGYTCIKKSLIPILLCNDGHAEHIQKLYHKFINYYHSKNTMFDSSWFKGHLYQIIERFSKPTCMRKCRKESMCKYVISFCQISTRICTQINIHVDCKVH